MVAAYGPAAAGPCRHMVLAVLLVAASLLGSTTVVAVAGRPLAPGGTILWSNASLGQVFATNSLALPNGDVLLAGALGRGSGRGLTQDALTLECLSHMTGETLWRAPIDAPTISYWPGLRMLIGERSDRAGAISSSPSLLQASLIESDRFLRPARVSKYSACCMVGAPVVVLIYGNGFSSTSMQVIDTQTGAVLVPGQPLPLGFGAGQPSVSFADGVTFMYLKPALIR
eukprot:COSAG01_NODE_8696_length_2694_cov_2.470520_3_plen_228_part_00